MAAQRSVHSPLGSVAGVLAPFAYEAALVTSSEEADLRAPGGAVTMALCGALDHDPPCPLAPHHTSTSRDRDRLIVRVVFAASAGDQMEVNGRIEVALAAGEFTGPDGQRTVWRMIGGGPSTVRTTELELVERLARSAQ
jgi:hypothetical protein